MLITSLNQIKRQHAESLALKLRLEASLASDCRRLIKHVAKDFETLYVSRRHQAISLESFKDDFTSTLKQHYRKVAWTFKDNIREGGKAASYSQEEAARLIDSKLIDYIHTRSKKQSGYILSTLEDNIDSDIHTIRVEAAASGMQTSPSEIAAKVKKKLMDGASGEAARIATTETQDMAEHSKLTEAQVLNSKDPSGIEKYWKATLDEITRIAHIFADGQVVGLDETFIVGAQEMLRPGDSSLGAELWNIINCRCDALYLSAEAGKAARFEYQKKMQYLGLYTLKQAA
jgi:hypothetical protein